MFVFTYNGILFSVINEDLKTVRTGNNSNTGPNAVGSDYGPDLNIPTHAIKENGKKYLVTEIGSFSFNTCRGVKSAYVPSTVRIIRKRGFAAMTNCVSLKFGEFSQLKTIEAEGLYDLYALESLTFTSNCITTVGKAVMMFASKIKTLTLPSSLININTLAFGGMIGLQTFYYCGSAEQSNAIFNTYVPSNPQTNASAEIYVTSRYKGTMLGNRSIKGVDDKHCQSQFTICKIGPTSTYTLYRISIAIFILIIIIVYHY